MALGINCSCGISVNATAVLPYDNNAHARILLRVFWSTQFSPGDWPLRKSGDGAAAQSSGSTFTSRWSWLLPTQNVTGVVELSTNTVRMLVSDGIRYCTAVPVLGSSRTTRSVCIVDAQISPFLSKLAR